MAEKKQLNMPAVKATGNREYKSDVFTMLMEYPEYALQVYNAINGSDYDDSSIVEIKTLERGISLTVHNDSAFVVDSNLSIYEHQSTVCPNMPLRSLIYYADIMRPYIKGRDIYDRVIINIPTPQFVVLYNGKEDQPEVSRQRLSDAFIHKTDNPEIELVCTVYNINNGKNKELVDNCYVLHGYMTFVNYVRQYDKDPEVPTLKDAIKRAMDRCIEEDILTEFFRSHYDEVLKVVELDYTIENRLKMQYKSAKEEGLSLGCEIGELRLRISYVTKKISKGKTEDEIIDELEDTYENIHPIYEYIIDHPNDTNEQIADALLVKN